MNVSTPAELVSDILGGPEKTGRLYFDLSPERYHAFSALSYSGLKELHRSPAHYLASRLRKEEPTDAQFLGTLNHMRTLERERFEKSVVVIDGRRNATAVKDKIKEAEESGKIPCKPDQYDTVCQMSDAILKHEIAKTLLTGGKPEVSFFVLDERGFVKKARPDYLRDDGVISDIKYFSNVSPSSVERQIKRMLYGWQSAFYLDVASQYFAKPLNFFAHIFVENEEPWGVNVFVLGDASLERARYQYAPLLDVYAECLRSDSWPNYKPEIIPVEIDFWE